VLFNVLGTGTNLMKTEPVVQEQGVSVRGTGQVFYVLLILKGGCVVNVE
jgi:hypothetical protein